MNVEWLLEAVDRVIRSFSLQLRQVRHPLLLKLIEVPLKLTEVLLLKLRKVLFETFHSRLLSRWAALYIRPGKVGCVVKCILT